MLNPRTGQLTWVEGRSKASSLSLFIHLLWRRAGEYRGVPRLHLILDNAAIHRSKKVQQALAQLGGRIVLHFLPPYCPRPIASSARGPTCTPTSHATTAAET